MTQALRFPSARTSEDRILGATSSRADLRLLFLQQHKVPDCSTCFQVQSGWNTH